jgi:hypothetical protein
VRFFSFDASATAHGRERYLLSCRLLRLHSMGSVAAIMEGVQMRDCASRPVLPRASAGSPAYVCQL